LDYLEEPIIFWLLKYSPGVLELVNDRLIDNFFVLAIVFLPVTALMVILARARLHAAAAIFFMVIFWTIIIYNQFIRPSEMLSQVLGAGAHMPAEILLRQSEDPGEYLGFAAAITAGYTMIFVLLLILLSVAPAKAVSRRLLFLAIGLLLLIALNELSKLGLDVTAPKLQG
jgi:hypothetical protein